MSMRLDNDFLLLKTPVPPNFTRAESPFHYNGPKIWNSSPYGIRSLADVEKFKKCLNPFILIKRSLGYTYLIVYKVLRNYITIDEHLLCIVFWPPRLSVYNIAF